MKAAAESSRAMCILRNEHKYKLDEFSYHRVRDALRLSTRADGYSMRAKKGRYFVRSLYFDTLDYQAYQEKVVGVPNRIKLRIRTYALTRDDKSIIKIEIKTRVGQRVGKFSEIVPMQSYDHFLTDRSWNERLGATAGEFRRLVLLRGLRPRVLVDYYREALIPRDGGDVRITFDHDLCYAQSTALFANSPRSYSARPKFVIMEIKVPNQPPDWLQSLARKFNFHSVPNSKYAQAIEQTQHSVMS